MCSDTHTHCGWQSVTPLKSHGKIHFIYLLITILEKSLFRFHNWYKKSHICVVNTRRNMSISAQNYLKSTTYFHFIKTRQVVCSSPKAGCSQISATVKGSSEGYNQQEMETRWMLTFIKFLLILCYNQDITGPLLLTANQRPGYSKD